LNVFRISPKWRK